MSTLRDYLIEKGLTQADFAAAVSVDQATVSRLARMAMRPSLELAVAIERETGGRVKAASWLPPKTAEGRKSA